MWQQIRVKVMSSPLPVFLGFLLILLSFSLLPAPYPLSLLPTTSFPREPGITHRLQQGPQGVLNLVTVAGHPYLLQASPIPLWSSYHCGPKEISHANREKDFNACATCHFSIPQTYACHFPGTKYFTAYFIPNIHSVPKGKVERQS